MKLCGFDVGLNQPFFLIAGTCSIEGLEMSIEVAGRLKEACSALGIPLIYKGSFDKANRSSGRPASRAAERALSMTFFMSQGAKNWPFLMFTGLPDCATARM